MLWKAVAIIVTIGVTAGQFYLGKKKHRFLVLFPLSFLILVIMLFEPRPYIFNDNPSGKLLKTSDDLRRNDTIKHEDRWIQEGVNNSSKLNNERMQMPKDAPKRRRRIRQPSDAALNQRFIKDRNVVESIPTEASGWIYNKTAADLFRNSLTHDSHLQNGNFLTTQKNTPLNSTIVFMTSRTTSMKVSRDVFERFPKVSPFQGRHFNTCSVVGNGGILIGSGCGKEIDASEFVFRCNMAPVDDRYAEDIGTKTSLITLNAAWTEHKYDLFETVGSVEAFLRDLSAYDDSYLWIPAFINNRTANAAFMTHQVLHQSRARTEVIFAHWDFMRSTEKYWRRNGLKHGGATTGLNLVSTATQICEEVHLFGFWPFHSDRNKTRLTRHYYSDGIEARTHNGTEEFRQLQNLHNAGIIRLKTNACQ